MAFDKGLLLKHIRWVIAPFQDSVSAERRRKAKPTLLLLSSSWCPTMSTPTQHSLPTSREPWRASDGEFRETGCSRRDWKPLRGLKKQKEKRQESNASKIKEEKSWSWNPTASQRPVLVTSRNRSSETEGLEPLLRCDH